MRYKTEIPIIINNLTDEEIQELTRQLDTAVNKYTDIFGAKPNYRIELSDHKEIVHKADKTIELGDPTGRYNCFIIMNLALVQPLLSELLLPIIE